MNVHSLHERAVRVAKDYLRCEQELLDILQQLDRTRGFREFRYTSLFDYCVKALGLSESITCGLIAIARKATQVPALKESIVSGSMTISNARRIAPILTPANQGIWLAKAKALPRAQLEREIAKVFPKQGEPEKVKSISENRLAMSISISDVLYEQLKRIQDLESTRLQRPVSLEEAIQSAAATHLHKHDPIEKAKRVQRTRAVQEVVTGPGTGKKERVLEEKAPIPNVRTPIPAPEEHAVRLREGDRCTAATPHGRCETRRWVQLHHIIPVREGGPNTRENLTLLCAAHHQMQHRMHHEPHHKKLLHAG